MEYVVSHQLAFVSSWPLERTRPLHEDQPDDLRGENMYNDVIMLDKMS